MGAISLLQWEKVARFTATDEVLLYVYYQNKPNLYMFALRHAPKIQPPCLGDADRVCSANRSIPHWRRLIKHIDADCIDEIPPSVLMQLFIFKKAMASCQPSPVGEGGPR